MLFFAAITLNEFNSYIVDQCCALILKRNSGQMISNYLISDFFVSGIHYYKKMRNQTGLKSF